MGRVILEADRHPWADQGGDLLLDHVLHRVGSGIESYNGTSWSTVATVSGYLDSVSCVTGGCVAVGQTGSSQPLIESTFGGTWSVVANSTATASLASVACASATSCVAVGSGSGLFAETWDGSAWTVDSPTAPTGSGAALTGVSCAVAGSCVAVGSDGGSTLAETYARSTWSVDPAAAVQSGSALQQVYCAGSVCTAVGHNSGTSLVESRQGGTWSVVAAPPGGRTADNSLVSVSCPTSSYCLGVGSYQSTSGAEKSLAEVWNGSKWAAVTAPGSGLTAVSCPDASTIFCAVATSGAGVAFWNGTRWTAPASLPVPSGATGATVRSMSCTSASSCVAVGFAGTGSLPLFDVWNGSTWAAETAPHPSSYLNELDGVSCLSPSWCVAVGGYYSFSIGNLVTLVENWDGNAVTVASSGSGIRGDLTGVSCPSTSSCNAITETWNGSTWTTVSDPDSATAVSCTSPTSCYAVGGIQDDLFYNDDHIESWDGTAWTDVPYQAVTGNALLGSVSCVTASCEAVGYYPATPYRTDVLAVGS